jgi:hypothetical protein
MLERNENGRIFGRVFMMGFLTKGGKKRAAEHTNTSVSASKRRTAEWTKSYRTPTDAV